MQFQIQVDEPALSRCPYPRQEYDYEMNRLNRKAGKSRIGDSTVHMIYPPSSRDPKEQIAMPALSGSK